MKSGVQTGEGSDVILLHPTSKRVKNFRVKEGVVFPLSLDI